MNPFLARRKGVGDFSRDCHGADSAASRIALSSAVARVNLVSPAGVALEAAGSAVANLAHDLDRAMAVGTERHLSARQNRDHPHGALAPVALG